MPGYHGTKVSFQPEMAMMHQPRSKEVLYPRHYPMGKMPNANPMGHPMFEAMRARHAQDKADYARMMKTGKMGGDGGYPTFDSLKLLGAENDANYLDVFMNEGGKLHRYPSEDNEFRPRARSCSQTKTSKKDKRNSVNMENICKTILGSLRSTASDEKMYESVEVIQYRKTIEAINRERKVRSVPKTGHPLFDALRVEKVMNADRHPHHSRQNSHNSDGGSNSQSSSGSGDEFDYARKPNCRFSRRELLMGSGGEARKPSHSSQEPQKHKTHKRDSRQNIPEAGSESDDDWAIPRPKICGGNGRSRRTGASGLMANAAHEESDSSSKSTGLR